MPFLGHIDTGEFISVIVRTVLIFLYAFILLRLLGRRRLAHLTYIDVLLMISFGSAVGDVMIYGESAVHFFASVVAITIVAILVKMLDEFSSHSQRAQAVIEGRARLLVDEGHVIQKALAKENMSVDNLLSMLRQKDIHELKTLKKVFIETDGELSIVFQGKKNKSAPTFKK